jgi:hypothetical protein
MADIKAIKELALYAAKKQVPVEFANKTVADVNDALRAELKDLCGTYNLYRRNKLDLFEIMQESMDAVVPAEVEQFVQTFAEVKNYANGVKPSFKIKKGKHRAKKFATRATASGVYETFRLDADTIDVNTFAIGDAAYIDFERFLSGDEDWADYMEALMAGILHRIYVEIFDCLIAQSTVENLQKYNMYEVDSNYHQENFLALINKVNNYGKAIVVACPEFINEMGPDAIVPGTSNCQGIYSPADIEAIANIGRIRQIRGTTIVEIPQSVVDERNSKLVFNPAYAFILPSAGEKVVKVAFEGQTVVKDWENRDNSMEIQAYKKMGTAIVTYNNWGIYKNSSLDSLDVLVQPAEEK